MTPGAVVHSPDRCLFTVWAPFRTSVDVRISRPAERIIAMTRDAEGYWRADVDGVGAGALYQFRLDGSALYPDPASHAQPRGVHGPSMIVDHASFRWNDAEWKGAHLPSSAHYELHVGTFTPEGTFDAVIPRLDALKELGVTALELMPVTQFPGERNWGYDGVYPFAVQDSYGGPDGLKRLVNACHRRGMAVILDVVYNHLGPEGNYLAAFGPYFTDRYRTPWGPALNFDGRDSDAVRDFFTANVRHWHTHYHTDGLRLDAIHAIFDMGARHILREIAEIGEMLSEESGRQFWLIAESNLNDPRVLAPRGPGCYGLHGQWLDDLHRSLHTVLTGENEGYYRDFGTIAQLVKALREGYVLTGEYSHYRGRRQGTSSAGVPADRFIVFSQNHDQVGNRARSDRLSSIVTFDAAKLAAATVILSPYIPLLFMGEEYGEAAPFNFFVSHTDEKLVDAVRKGRREEFARFNWSGTPPDPQRQETFNASRLHWESRTQGHHAVMLSWYAELLRIRRETPALAHPGRDGLIVEGSETSRIVMMMREYDTSRVLILLNFSSASVPVDLALPEGPWRRILDSSAAEWSGQETMMPGEITAAGNLKMSPHNVVVYGGW